MLNMITNISLAHCAANVKRHGGSYVFCGLGCENDPSDLRPVAVNDGYFISFAVYIGKIPNGALDYGKLTFGGIFDVL